MSNFLQAIMAAQARTCQSLSSQQATDAQTVKTTVRVLSDMMAQMKKDLNDALTEMNKNINNNNAFAYWQAEYNKRQNTWNTHIGQIQSGLSQNQGIVTVDGTNLQQQLQVVMAINTIAQMLSSLLGSSY